MEVLRRRRERGALWTVPGRGDGLGPSEGLALDQKSSPVSGAGRKDETDQVWRPVVRGSRPMAKVVRSTVP